MVQVRSIMDITFNSFMESSRFGEHFCSSLIESIYIPHYYIYDYLLSFSLGSSIEKIK